MSQELEGNRTVGKRLYSRKVVRKTKTCGLCSPGRGCNRRPSHERGNRGPRIISKT